MIARLIVAGGLTLLAACLSTAADRLPAPAQRSVDFKRDIEPMLRQACLRCHGEKKQRSSYRLDVRKDAVAGGDLGVAIVPGESAKSPLIHYVAGTHAEVAMPPGKKDRLSATQIGLLRAWIDQGAKFPEGGVARQASGKDWWSLRALERPHLPELSAAERKWVRNPIDSFVRKKLAEQGLEPSPEADRRTLMRRLSFDLTGLPPTPEEVEAFLADQKPKAYERLVDRLLASPRYGERWARHWLDVVHYGETHGYDKDKPRYHAWPYRDYVIRSFNQDKPYGRFVQEQIAGDVLYPGTADGIEALGFIAAGPWDFIGHVELPESKIDGKVARHLDRDDMVSNTMSTFASLTVHCAQCHDHKFDPIEQEDYYRLQAVFAALDRADRSYDRDPAIAKRRQDLRRGLSKLDERRANLEQAIAKQAGPRLAELEQAIEVARKMKEKPRPPQFGYHSRIEPDADRVKWVQVDLGKARPIESIVLCACNEGFAGIGAGFGYPTRFKIEIGARADFAGEVHLVADHTKTDAVNPKTRPELFRVGGKQARFVRVTATRLAPRMGDFCFALDEMKVLDAAGKNLARGATVTALDSIEARPRWARRNLVDGVAVADARTPVDLEKLEAEKAALLEKTVDAKMRRQLEALQAEQARVEKERAALPPQSRAYIGTVHHGRGNFVGTGAKDGQARPIHVLRRGDVKKPGKEIEPGGLACFEELAAHFYLPADHREGDRRAALARWLTDRRNPLTWRSIVNRVWLYHFGRGLAATPSDFGRMGQQPSHPELLDWLAVDFRDGKQSLKDLHRLMVTSAAYRQSSRSRPEYERRDAGNVYLWRMKRRRLEAEAVRDSILFVSGKLDLKMGGPSFQDFVIEKPQHSPHYEYHLFDAKDPKCHRRSVYRFVVRSQQQPFLATLDCADPSLMVARRNQTITPLQALTMLNNQLVLVLARHLADRARQAAGGNVEEEVSAALRLALSRPANKEERRILAAHAKQHGLASTCRLILNLNEFIFVD